MIYLGDFSLTPSHWMVTRMIEAMLRRTWLNVIAGVLFSTAHVSQAHAHLTQWYR